MADESKPTVRARRESAVVAAMGLYSRKDKKKVLFQIVFCL